ncbi:MAG: DUF6502 family protein [Rubrivivax sp.]
MKSLPATHATLEVAIVRLLRPLFRILLRQGMAFTAFERLARQAYVDIAFNEFALPGKKQTISRVSILSGLTRKDVQRLLAAPDELAPQPEVIYNRAARVLTGWVRDADFSGAEPRTLEIDGERGFAGLVRRYSGDMPARAVLDELLRVGAVQRREDGRVELRTRAYVPQQGSSEKLQILGSDVADLISTIGHNMQHGTVDARFQRKVLYSGIEQSTVPAFRQLGAAMSQVLLERLDRWLSTQLRAGPPTRANQPRVRVGLGIYYIEQPLESDESSEGADK